MTWYAVCYIRVYCTYICGTCKNCTGRILESGGRILEGTGHFGLTDQCGQNAVMILGFYKVRLQKKKNTIWQETS